VRCARFVELVARDAIAHEREEHLTARTVVATVEQARTSRDAELVDEREQPPLEDVAPLSPVPFDLASGEGGLEALRYRFRRLRHRRADHRAREKSLAIAERRERRGRLDAAPGLGLAPRAIERTTRAVTGDCGEPVAHPRDQRHRRGRRLRPFPSIPETHRSAQRTGHDLVGRGHRRLKCR
jgi:hypothetical protein